MSIRTKAFVALLLVSILWGSAGVVAKILIQELHPYVVLFYRFGIAAIVLLPWFIKAKKPAHMWRVLIPFSLLVAGNAIFFYLGISRTTVSSSAIIGATVPLVTAILSRLFINEHTSRETFVGIIIGLVGAMYITLLPLWKEGKLLGGDIVGNLFLVAGLLCWTSYVVGSRYFLSKDTYSPLVMVETNFLTLAGVCIILALVTRQQFFAPRVLDPIYLFVLFYGTIPVTVGSFGLFQWALKHISATTASLKDYIQLVVGVTLSLIVLKEKVNASFIIGSLIVILGISIATGRSTLSKIIQRLTPVN
jgi:drug/metabolite transporter (DMT)-like permease